MISKETIDNLINNFNQSEWQKFEMMFVKVLEDEDEIVIITRSKNDRPPIITIERHNKNPKPLPSDTSTTVIKEW